MNHLVTEDALAQALALMRRAGWEVSELVCLIKPAIQSGAAELACQSVLSRIERLGHTVATMSDVIEGSASETERQEAIALIRMAETPVSRPGGT